MCCGDDGNGAQRPNEEGVPISAGDLERCACCDPQPSTRY